MNSSEELKKLIQRKKTKLKCNFFNCLPNLKKVFVDNLNEINIPFLLQNVNEQLVRHHQLLQIINFKFYK